MAKKKDQKEQANSTLKEMVTALNELPTDVLEQLNKNLDDIETYREKSLELLNKDPIYQTYYQNRVKDFNLLNSDKEALKKENRICSNLVKTYQEDIFNAELESLEILSNVEEDEDINNYLKEHKKTKIIRYSNSKALNNPKYNYYYVSSDFFDKDTFAILASSSDKHNEDFMRIICPNKEYELYIWERFSYIETLVMMRNEMKKNCPYRDDLVYDNVRENGEIIYQIINLNRNVYEEKYHKKYDMKECELFLERMMEEDDQRINIWGAYIGDQLVASCYTFYNGSSVKIGNLVVNPNERKKYIASNFINYLFEQFKCPMYAEVNYEDDLPQIYRRMGFHNLFSITDHFKSFK